MKTSNVNGHACRKWSIRDCDGNGGWKLKDVRRKQVKPESLDGVKVMRELYTTNFDSKFEDRYWRVGGIYTIENDKLKSQFEEYKKDLVEMGRPPDTIKETLVFSAETEKSCKDICQEGCKVATKKRHILGHTGSGVHLVRHYDILTRYLTYQQSTSPAYIIVYKTLLGKTKPIVPRLHKDDHYVPPYVGFDSHVSARHIDKEMPICEALNCSYVYVYEFDPIASNPVKYPRQILPYVIIELEKKVPCVPESPFLAVGTDETRSTWEVKGETRRGFRFMFTKSGLKGKHKVFSKGCNRANLGSYLKGQILEMRTKSAFSVSEAKPPLLQKIDNSNININTEELDKSKPPDLQKCASSSQRSPTKNEKFIFCKELENIVIPKSLRETRQLLKLKPCVKLKRLDSAYLTRAGFRIENGNKKSNNVDSGNTKSNFDIVLKEKTTEDSMFSSSEEDKDKSKASVRIKVADRNVSCESDSSENESILRSGNTHSDFKTTKTHKESKPKEFRTDHDSKLNSEVTLKSRDIGGNKFKLTSCSMYKDKTESVTPNANSESNHILLLPNDKTYSIRNKTRNRIIDTNLVKDKKKTKTVKDKTEILRKKHKDNTVDVCPKTVLNSETVSFCDKKSEREISSVSNVCTSGVKINPCTALKNIVGEQTLLRIDSVSVKESSSGAKIIQGKDNKTDKRKIDTDENVNSSKTKQKCSHQTLNNQVSPHDADIRETCTSLKKNEKKRLYRSKTFTAFKTSELRLRISKAKNSQTDKSKTKTAHQKESQLEGCPQKEKQKKALSSRCSPTKNKFGTFTCKINKGDEKLAKHATDRLRFKPISETSEQGKTIAQAKSVFDFNDPSQSLHEEQNTLKVSLPTEIQVITENNYLASKSCEHSNELIQMRSLDKVKDCDSISITGVVSSDKHTDSHEGHNAKKSDTAETEHTFETQIRNQTQHMVLEKSKSPVVANAAPDMLNICPVLVSAQTSTCSQSDTTVTAQNVSEDVRIPSENSKQTTSYRETDLVNKNKLFYSEMANFYDNIDKLEPLGLVEQFPEPFTQTHVVNPVLRGALSAEIELPTQVETNRQQSKKNKNEQSKRKLEIDTSTEQPEPETSSRIGVRSRLMNRKGTPDCKQTDAFLSKPYKTTAKTPKGKQNESSNLREELSDVNTTPKEVITQTILQKETLIPIVPSSLNKEQNSTTNIDDKIIGIKEAQATHKTMESSKGIRSIYTSRDENKNKIISKDNPFLSVSTSAAVVNGSSDSKLHNSETSDLLHVSCGDKHTFANYSNSIGDQIDSSGSQAFLCTSEHINESKVSSKKKGLNRLRKKADKTNTEKLTIHISAAERETSTKKLITNSNESNTTSKHSEERRDLEVPENVKNVTVDTLTADRLRSFLGTTAAVAMLHRKSVDKKNDEVEDISSATHNQSQMSPKHEDGGVKSKLSVDQSGTESVNTISNLDVNSPKPNCEAKTKDISTRVADSDKTEESVAERLDDIPQISDVYSPEVCCKINLQEHLKEPRVMLQKQKLRRDSVEMHDSDSQDTVIGGVRSSPSRHINSASFSQENLKSFDNLLTKLKPQEIHPCIIKQETKADGYQDESILNGNSVDSNCERRPPMHKAMLSLNCSQSDEVDNQIMSNCDIKQEPVDCMSGGSIQLTPNIYVANQPVKAEPISPSCFFPKTRRELAKGAAMLNATECRSAIIDTLKELSSVLKVLTADNSQKEKQTENVALVARKMCNVLSYENTTKLSIDDEGLHTSELATKDNVVHGLHIKAEPNNIDYSKILDNSSHSVLNRSIFTPKETFYYSDEEENYFEAECSSADQEFQYEYILKTSEDEFQQTCDENDADKCPVNDSIHEVSLQNEPVQTNYISSKGHATQNESTQNPGPIPEATMVTLTQHESDELPQLFDPNKEPDISCLEHFGIPNKLHRKKSVSTKITSVPFVEKYNADNDNSTTQPVKDSVKEIKTEKDLESSPAKPKPKYNFSLKSGVLNKGLKDRKNMFDLKTNVSRRKTVVNVSPIDRKIAVIPNPSFAVKPSAQSNVPENIELNASVKEDNHEEANVVMNEVYRTVCEKLSTLREHYDLDHDGNFTSENTNPVAESISKKKESESLSCQDNVSQSKSIQPHENPVDKCKEKAPISIPREVVKKTNIKKHAVIPFHTVIKLKKQQFWKYRRGETNKKFIDYSELFSKLPGRQAKSFRQASDLHEKQNMSDQQAVTTDKSETNENLGKKLNYFIPSCKTSEISERGTALIEDNINKDSHLENVNLKRSKSDSDERKKSKRFKLSTDETGKTGAESNRSRSRSSHRSSASGQRSTGHSSLSEKHTSYNDRRGAGSSSVRPHRRLNDKYNHNKTFSATKTHFNRRGTYRPYPTRFHFSSNQNQRFAGKSSFRKSGTGYFSWRRKYQPHRNIFDGKGSVQTMSEYAEWNRFKERETLRDQIENAIKEYRRTFQDTPDDKKGDEKVASYLTFLTEKLDKIQSKRDKIGMVEPNKERRRRHRSASSERRQRSTSSENVPPRSSQRKPENKSPLSRKLEKSHNFHQHETQQHSSMKRFSSSLASDSDSFSYKQRRHASCIEEYLKEHITKHCQHLTKQIKQEMEELKTAKPSSSEKEDKESSYPKDFNRNKYDCKNDYGDDKCHRPSRERYDSNRTSTGNSSKHGDEYDKTYHGSRGKPYHRNYRQHDKYDKGKHSYDRGDKHYDRYSYGDEYGRREDSFRKQHNSSYHTRYNKNYGTRPYREYDPRHFGDSNFVNRNSRSNVDRSHSKSQDYRKSYDYQQNFDKYQTKFQEHYKTQHEHNAFKSDMWKRSKFRNTDQHSEAFQPKHWFRGKYKRYFNKSGADSKEKVSESIENEKLETEKQPVQAEFDATQYRQFIPTYNKRGRGFHRGTNKFQPAHKQHYQPAKFSKFRNPATYFTYEDVQVNSDDKNGKETSCLEGPRNGGTSIEITLGNSDKKSIQESPSGKSDQPKSIPALGSVQQTPQREEM